MRFLLIAALAVLLQPGWLQAAVLDNPNSQTGEIQSGVYPIFGWKCDAGTLTIRFNGTTEVEAAYGTARGDTVGQCGDTNNGFSLLWNWNLLGVGTHVVEALDDGVVFDSVTVSVVTLGQEFPTGLSGTGLVTLSNGQQVTVEWSEPRQGFILTGVSSGESTLITPGLWLGSGQTTLTLICFHVSADGTRLTTHGNACDGETIAEASLDIDLVNLADNCMAELETNVDIPIVKTTANTTFSHQQVVGNQTIRVAGIFQLPNFASGTIRATNDDTAAVCEGDWIASPF